MRYRQRARWWPLMEEMICVDEGTHRFSSAQTRLTAIPAPCPMTRAGGDVCGTVMYADDCFAVVSFDNGFEETALVGELRLVGQ